MATPDEIKTIVRFGLDQLRAQNGHHDFEHLCRHLARARICSNIIPSTGPVGAGGDQGRDFETFRTYLHRQGIESVFAGRASDSRLAFACTIQRDGIEAKIRGDVHAICASGFQASCIHVFLAEDLPTAKRHSLQAWARDHHSIELEIYDGNAIAELLADPQIFWIASSYLKIPAEQFPAANGEDWYGFLAARIRQEPKQCETEGQFFELKQLSRHATGVEGLASDLPEWIERLSTVPESSVQLRRSAMYEVFVASLRGLNTLEGYEGAIRSYLSPVDSLSTSGELKDAACLLSYCLGALARGVLSVEPDEIASWYTKLASRTDALLGNAQAPNVRAALLDLKWYLAISPRPNAQRPPMFDDAFPWLEELATVVGEAPLFPLEKLVDNLTKMQEFLQIVDLHRYQAITSALDALLGKRQGEQAVAEKSRDRAIAFLDADRPLVALRFIHDAAVRWFSQETLAGSLAAQLVTARTYDSLGLCKAAQYFALASAFVALSSDAPGIRARSSLGLFAAAEYAFHSGEWARFIDLSELALKAHGLFAPTPGDTDRYPALLRTGFHVSNVVALLEKLQPAAARKCLERIEGWQIGWLLDDMLVGARGSKVAAMGEAELWHALQSQLHGRPLADAGKTRRLEWRQLGVLWRFQWSNRLEVTAVAEQLVATLQAVLVDLADDDLCLLPATVHARVRVGELSVVREPSNSHSRWRISIPTGMNADDAVGTTIGLVAAILTEITVLPFQRFESIIKERFQSGLSSRVFMARPYAELLTELLEEARTLPARELAPVFAARRFKLREHPALRWRSDFGPYYSHDEAQRLLQLRYDRLVPPLQSNISAASKLPRFRATLARLRGSGWRDWHILSAMYSILFNHQAQQSGRANPEGMNALRAEMTESSREFEVLATEPFSEDAMRLAQQFNMLATLKNLGHELHQETPSFQAIERFLATRYRYWLDDVTHDDPFAVNSQSSETT